MKLTLDAIAAHDGPEPGVTPARHSKSHSKRTRVLVIIPTLEVGGAEIDLLRILPRLDQTAFEVVIFTFLARGVLAHRLETAGIEIVGPFLTSRPRWLRDLKQVLVTIQRRLARATSKLKSVLRQFIAANMPDVIRDAARQFWSICWLPLSRLHRHVIDCCKLLARYLPAPVLHLLRNGSVWSTYVIIGMSLAPFIRTRRVDVIHTVLPNSYVVGSVANLLFNRRPLIMSRVSLNWYQQLDPLFHFVERRLLHRNIGAAVGNCQEILRELREEGIPGQRLRLIQNGIDVGDFSRRIIRRDAARDALGISKTAIVLSVVANLHGYKGHADVIRSLHYVSKEMPEWILLVVGRDVGTNRAWLEALSDELGVMQNMQFLGERNDVPVILSAADIHVSGSHTEGLPNNIIEAMCAGLPVIATTVGGTGELVLDQKTGCLVPNADPIRMGQAILGLAKDRELRRRMGQAGRKHVISCFSVDRSVAAFETLYAEIAACPRNPKPVKRKNMGTAFAWPTLPDLSLPNFYRPILAAFSLRNLPVQSTLARFSLRNLLIHRRERLRSNVPTDFDDMAAVRPPSFRPQPLRILMVVPSFARGGAERMMVATAAGLVRRGYQVRMLALQHLPPGDPQYLDEIKLHGLDHRICRGSPMSFWQWWRRFNNGAMRPYAASLPAWFYDWAAEIAVTIQDFRPTVVHTWLDQATVIAGLVSCRMGVPRIIGGQHNILTSEIRDWLDSYLPGFRAVANHPNVTLTNVGAVGAKQYECLLDLPAQSIKVLPNMFWPESVRQPSPEEVFDYRHKLGIPAKVPVVGTVIRLVEAKDPHLWLEAAAQIVRVRPDVRFVIAGYGELVDSVSDRVRALGLTDRVILPGPVADVGLIYAICDVVMLTSRIEGSPVVLIEAQSVGLPVVAPDVGAIRETVLDGLTARIVTRRSASAFAEAVLGILSDPEWRVRAAMNGPAFVAQRFGQDRILDSTLALYGLPVRPQMHAALRFCNAFKRRPAKSVS